MPLETGTYISDLVATNPAHGDGLSQSDGHHRLIKAVLQATFPNLTGAVTATQIELNQLHTGTRTLGLADGTSGAPSLAFDSQATLGFYKAATDKLGVTKRLVGNGANYVGEVHSFVRDPGSTILARGGTATGTEAYVELDGSTYATATFPDLSAIYSGAANFTVDNWTATGRFPRSRTGAVAVGTTQSNQNKNHAHTASGTTSTSVTVVAAGTHSHTATDSGHVHGIAFQNGVADGSASTVTLVNAIGFGAGVGGVTQSASAVITVSTAPDHTHSASAVSTTGVTVNASTDGGTEARPEAMVVIFCVKT